MNAVEWTKSRALPFDNPCGSILPNSVELSSFTFRAGGGHDGCGRRPTRDTVREAGLENAAGYEFEIFPLSSRLLFMAAATCSRE